MMLSLSIYHIFPLEFIIIIYIPILSYAVFLFLFSIKAKYLDIWLNLLFMFHTMFFIWL